MGQDLQLQILFKIYFFRAIDTYGTLSIKSNKPVTDNIGIVWIAYESLIVEIPKQRMMKRCVQQLETGVVSVVSKFQL